MGQKPLWEMVPWHVVEGAPQVRHRDGWLVCETADNRTARLIAAAPLMYEELEAAHFALADLHALTGNADIQARIRVRMENIRAALDKAAS